MVVWKSKYVQWYRIIEATFGACVPHLSDEQIQGMVFETDWMIIPLEDEADKNKAKNAMRPNLFIGLSEDKLISFGIVYEKIDSVLSLRDIIAPFNEKERFELLSKMRKLDDTFATTVDRKLKPDHFSQSPQYETVFEEKSNRMDLDEFIKAFKAVDEIMAERTLLDPEKVYQLAPTISLVRGETKRTEHDFKQALGQIRGIYEITVAKMRTNEQYQICNDCVCFMCDPKLPECKCPCPSYPKPSGKKVACYRKDPPRFLPS